MGYTLRMGWNVGSEPGRYAGQLADHASQLQREARAALTQGDYARAAALIDDAAMLAEDVHDLVDAIEARDGWVLRLLAARQADATPLRDKPRRPFFTLPPRRVRLALGTSIAMSLALVEC